MALICGFQKMACPKRLPTQGLCNMTTGVWQMSLPVTWFFSRSDLCFPWGWGDWAREAGYKSAVTVELSNNKGLGSRPRRMVIHPVCPGWKDFLWHGTFNGETGRVPSKPEWLDCTWSHHTFPALPLHPMPEACSLQLWGRSKTYIQTSTSSSPNSPCINSMPPKGPAPSSPALVFSVAPDDYTEHPDHLLWDGFGLRGPCSSTIHTQHELLQLHVELR